MATASSIIRSSLHSFLNTYHASASLAVLLIFPASAATLLSSSSSSLSLILAVSHRLRSIFEAANFPSDSSIFVALAAKLSQTIISFLFTLPFTLTFLTLSKACIIFAARKPPSHRHASPSFSSILHLYLRLLLTHLFTGFIILSANFAAFSMLFMAFSAINRLSPASRSFLLLLSRAGPVIYSMIVANVLVTCNLASTVSAMENCNGYTAVLKACWLIRGKASVALSLALCTNLAMAAAEALFQMRVVRPFQEAQKFDVSLLFEALAIAYMYSIISVMEIIISCCFYKSCRDEDRLVNGGDLDPEEKGGLRV